MKSLNLKKTILSAICLLAFFAGIGIVYSAAKEGKGIIKFLNGPTPSITNAFIDKEKYFPGDIMAITAETKDASRTQAFVENEAGFNEVILIVAASFEGKETWTGKWKVENSQEGKKYKLRIVASNKSGIAETILEWEDPNPGHPWNQIENFPAACPLGQVINKIGDPPSCIIPPGGSPTTWDCEYVKSPIISNYMEFGYAYCTDGRKLISGGVSEINFETYSEGPINGAGRDGWFVRHEDSTGFRIGAYAICCK